MIAFDTIDAKRLIVHGFPRSGATDRTGDLADLESTLTDEVAHFFEERARSTLSTHGISISFVPGHTSPVPSLVQKELTSTRPKRAQFAAASRAIAAYLFALPYSTRTEGLFCLLRFDDSAGRQVLTIVKLDYEEGTRAVLSGSKGKRHYDIKHLKDLMLTNKTQVFKIAAFQMPDGKAGLSDIEGVLCDNQARRADAADYFLDGFLGCRRVGQADIYTRDFLTSAEQFINQEVQDPETRRTYQTAILAELNSNRATVHPSAFAQTYLAKEHRMAFAKRIADAGVPTTVFPKDTVLVKSRLHRVMFDMEHDITLAAPPEQIDHAVRFSKDPDGRDQVSIHAGIIRTRGAK